MNVNCPHCHTSLQLDALVEDRCGRHLFGKLMQMTPTTAGNTIAYLGLFKPRIQALRWSRALSLLEEVEQLDIEPAVLGPALGETVEALRERRTREDWKPLTNHRYLLSVATSVKAGATARAPQSAAAPAGQSKTAQAAELLANYPTPEGVPDTFTRMVCGALRDWVVLNLEGRPGADVLGDLAGTWINKIWSAKAWEEPSVEFNLRYLKQALKRVEAEAKKWPQPSDVLAHLQGVKRR